VPLAEARAALPADVALHARPAGRLVREAARYQATIHLAAGGRRALARSILELLALGAVGGTELVVTADGPDAEVAVAELATLIAGLSDRPT
jgi:phosphocarrier protein HPr